VLDALHAAVGQQAHSRADGALYCGLRPLPCQQEERVMRKRDRREYSERYYREVAKPRVTPEQKARVLERVRARRKANPERTRNSCRASWLKKKYNWPVGLSYNAMLAVQGGLCAICRQAQTQTNKWGTRYAL